MNKFLLLSALVLPLMSGCVSQTQVVVGKDSNGEDILRTVSFDPKKAANSRIRLAMAQTRQHEMAEAKRNLDIAQQYDPGTENLYLGWGAYYSEVGDDFNAEKTYKEGLEKFPSGTMYTDYANYLCSRKHSKEAEQMYMKALEDKKYSNIGYTYEQAATCAYDANDREKAGKYFAQAMNYGGNRPSLLFNYARYCYDVADYVKADKLMQTFDMFYKDDNAQALFLKIKIATALGQYATAEIFGRRLLKLFPKSDEAKQYQAGAYGIEQN